MNGLKQLHFLPSFPFSFASSTTMMMVMIYIVRRRKLATLQSLAAADVPPRDLGFRPCREREGEGEGERGGGEKEGERERERERSPPDFTLLQSSTTCCHTRLNAKGVRERDRGLASPRFRGGTKRSEVCPHESLSARRKRKGA